MTAERVCGYFRVSTAQQAQQGISILDQRNKVRAYADERGWEIVAEFEEAGASARDDQRPVLQQMVSMALMKPPPFTRIVFHSMSRFFRDEIYYETYRRKLSKNGVQLVSITQDFGEGPAADLTRRIMAISDELNSAETAKHVRRTMIENARQGFWNGSLPPLGYKVVVAEVRGHKQKKRLEIDPEGAATVRLIYSLYLEGDGTHGPLGIKNIVKYLNDRGFRTPKGNAFHTSYVEKLLKHEAYVGRFPYNRRDTVQGVIRPKEEQVTIPVPPLIPEDVFQRVQAKLTLQSPKVTAPRLVNSQVLLGGLVRCARCGRPMRRDTGKGGKYRYYRCVTLKRTGDCAGGIAAGVNADTLDRIVLSRIADQLLVPERVQAIVGEVAKSRQNGTDRAITNLRLLREQRGAAGKKITNSMNALANGVEATATFVDTIRQAESETVRLDDLIAAQQRILETKIGTISLEQAAATAERLHRKLLGGSPTLQKRIIRSFVREIVVTDEEIAIVCANADLAEVVTGSLSNGRIKDGIGARF